MKREGSNLFYKDIPMILIFHIDWQKSGAGRKFLTSSKSFVALEQ